MSGPVLTFTMLLEGNELPGSPPDDEAIVQLLDKKFGEDCLLVSSSRNQIMLGLLKQLLEIWPMQSLVYLLSGYHTLGPSEVDEAADGVAELLLKIKQYPMQVANAIGYPEEDIINYLSLSKSSLQAPIGMSDENDDPMYLFSFLKSHMELLKFAGQSSRYVLYVQKG